MGERQSGYLSVSFSAFSQFTDSVLLHIRLNPRRRDISVSRNPLARYTARHLRIRRLVQFIFAGAVYDNVLTNCATRSCCACVDLITCVAERYLTLRIGCEKHGRKNPLPFPFSKRSHVGNLRQIRKQGKGRSSKRKGNRRCPFLFAPAAGAATLPPSADGESPAEVQRKNPRPLGANTLTQFACPGQPMQEKEPPVRGEHANAVRVPRSAGAEKEPPVRGEHANAVRAPRSAGAGKRAAPSGRTRLRQFVCPGQPVQEKGEDAKSNGETAANFVYCYKIAQNRSVLLEMTGAKC